MNIIRLSFVRWKRRTGRSIVSFVALLAFGAGLVNAAPAPREEGMVSIGIVVPKNASGDAVLPHGEDFEVGITNHSDRPLKIWEEMCQPGHRSLTFWVKRAGENAPTVEKRDVSVDVWSRYPPRTRTIPPKGSQTRKVNFSEFFWGDKAWRNVPEPNGKERVEIKAVFEIASSDEAKNSEVWTGKVESSPLTVLVVNPKLKTPHEYLWNNCPQQALSVLKSDPGWIRRTDDMQCTPLHHAARFGPKEVVVWLVENGADVNATCYNQFTPLYFASSFGKTDILKYLIEKGAKLEAPSNGGSPIQAAAQHKNREVVKALREAGAGYDLETAISLSDEEGIKALLEKNPALARGDNHMHSASRIGHPGIVSLLLAGGADPNDSRRHWKDPPLLAALPHPSIVKLLLDKGADPKVRLNIKGLPFGSTLLHEASQKGYLESARLLIDHGADVDAIYVDRFMSERAKETVFTPLHCAASGGQPKLVELLLERKADPKRRTSNGETALQLAGARVRPAEDPRTQAENQRYAEVIKVVAARGLEMDLFTAIALGDDDHVSAILRAKPDSIKEKDSQGKLPLQRAVGMGQRSIVEKLLGAGAAVNGVGQYGRTPLHEAAFWGRPDMVQLLLDRGANADIKADREATALSEAKRVFPHSARKQEYEEVIKLLSERTRP